jgi:hypothetical protein
VSAFDEETIFRAFELVSDRGLVDRLDARIEEAARRGEPTPETRAALVAELADRQDDRAVELVVRWLLDRSTGDDDRQLTESRFLEALLERLEAAVRETGAAGPADLPPRTYGRCIREAAQEAGVSPEVGLEIIATSEREIGDPLPPAGGFT